MTHLALLRHGQSEWNLQNRFTGWVDVDLTDGGKAEAKRAGALLKATGVRWAAAYTSVQKRAIHTLNIALDEMDMDWLPVIKDWRLNERHYGGLTGLDKKETAAKHGDEQVKIWRRSFDTPPPPIDSDSPHNPARDPRYAGLGDKIPATESLKTTLERVTPVFEAEIAPRLILISGVSPFRSLTFWLSPARCAHTWPLSRTSTRRPAGVLAKSTSRAVATSLAILCRRCFLPSSVLRSTLARTCSAPMPTGSSTSGSASARSVSSPSFDVSESGVAAASGPAAFSNPRMAFSRQAMRSSLSPLSSRQNSIGSTDGDCARAGAA